MKILCVLTNMFPYGNGETYMESEIEYYDKFDQIYMLSLMLRSEAKKIKREVPQNIKVVPVDFANKTKYVFWACKALTDRNLIHEVIDLLQQHRFSISRLIRAIVFFGRAHYEAAVICKNIGDLIKGQKVVFYSYRFEYQPYVAVLVRKKLKLHDAPIVARAHGYDLYEERNTDKYIPFREGALNNLVTVFPVSMQGEEYLKKKYPGHENKITKKYLGTVDYGVQDVACTDEEFIIVSCSSLAPVKRVDRIVDTISNIKETKIRWIHFGGKSNWLENEVEKLPKNIDVVLMGVVKNEVVMEYYKTHHVDLFINLSDSEGLPVSIMEAMSFGVPCVATDVGGTSEIVVDGYNGLLVKSMDSTQMIADKITANLQRIKQMRLNARRTWEYSFKASENYMAFNKELYNLLEDENL